MSSQGVKGSFEDLAQAHVQAIAAQIASLKELCFKTTDGSNQTTEAYKQYVLLMEDATNELKHGPVADGQSLMDRLTYFHISDSSAKFARTRSVPQKCPDTQTDNDDMRSDKSLTFVLERVSKDIEHSTLAQVKGFLKQHGFNPIRIALNRPTPKGRVSVGVTVRLSDVNKLKSRAGDEYTETNAMDFIRDKLNGQRLGGLHGSRVLVNTKYWVSSPSGDVWATQVPPIASTKKRRISDGSIVETQTTAKKHKRTHEDDDEAPRPTRRATTSKNTKKKRDAARNNGSNNQIPNHFETVEMPFFGVEVEYEDLTEAVEALFRENEEQKRHGARLRSGHRKRTRMSFESVEGDRDLEAVASGALPARKRMRKGIARGVHKRASLGLGEEEEEEEEEEDGGAGRRVKKVRSVELRGEQKRGSSAGDDHGDDDEDAPRRTKKARSAV